MSIDVEAVEVPSMILTRITEDNMAYALAVQEKLFPGESARANFEESIDDTTDYEYYLLYDTEACVGIIGIYQYPEEPDSAWLGWFGIREEYRRKHLGSTALRIYEKMAAERGYRFARLYTDAESNEAAIAFYKANGYMGEP